MEEGAGAGERLSRKDATDPVDLRFPAGRQSAFDASMQDRIVWAMAAASSRLASLSVAMEASVDS